jgi:methionyl-tRNA synthetase
MSRRFYITTPIYYVSDPPHIGHAYTTIVADAIARYHRMRGEQVHYLTGTDEHGQKIARIAEERGKSPKLYSDEIAQKYRDAWTALGIANDDFIRTTDPDHEAEVQALWKVLEARGDIYLAEYEGPYCVACEQFYTDKELVDGKCPVHKRPIEIVKEQSYYFRLSKYRDALLKWYAEKNPVRPAVRMNEVRTFVEGDLRDVSVSRTTFTWGVPVPGHDGHVVYVWIDALSNYFSATRRKGPTKGVDYWPPSGEAGAEIVHVLGKEISRFHAVYWPAILMAAGLRLPDVVFCHGWWTVDGEKMSKTAGNVVDPLRLAAELGADAVRYFVLREVPLGLDGDFSHEALLTRFNSELANDLGNLLNRTLGMVHKYFPAGHVPPRPGVADPLQTTDTVSEWGQFLDRLEPSRALEEIFALVRRCNAYIDQQAPWKADSDRPTILGNVLEACRIVAHLISPVMPERARALLVQLGPEVADEPFTVPRWEGERGWKPPVGTPLFPRLDDDRKKALLESWRPRPPLSGAALTMPSAPPPKPTATPAAGGQISFDEFSRLELRVAQVLAAEAVPKAKKLLKLTVDLGPLGQRQVVAGIAEAYVPDALVGKRVIMVCNLAPATIRGVASEGMILAAGDEAILGLSTVDAVTIPPGTRVR